MTTAGAVQANRTREERAAIARLRDGHFTRPAKSAVRDHALDFLQSYMEPGEAMGDLLGPGWSALAATARGMRVIAADNLSFTSKVLGSRDLARRTAERMGIDGGFEVRVADFGEIVSDVRTAFFDPCGPPSERWAATIRQMADARLDAFAATCLLSRLDGARGLGEDAYVDLASLAIGRSAPDYHIITVERYRGDANLPMAVFMVERLASARLADEQKAAAERREREREHYRASLAGRDVIKYHGPSAAWEVGSELAVRAGLYASHDSRVAHDLPCIAEHFDLHSWRGLNSLQRCPRAGTGHLWPCPEYTQAVRVLRRHRHHLKTKAEMSLVIADQRLSPLGAARALDAACVTRDAEIQAERAAIRGGHPCVECGAETDHLGIPQYGGGWACSRSCSGRNQHKQRQAVRWQEASAAFDRLMRDDRRFAA